MKQYIILLILLVSGALTVAPAFAQKSGTKHTVTGKVTDQSGEPLIGATVLVTGTTNGASTNATGDYSIQVPEGASLTFQYIGYEAKTEKVGARTKVDVKLEQSKQTIDEVVVIGYGTVKKTDLTGSVANVKMSDIKDVPVVSVDQALQGRIAGADIMATTGEPGATTSIRIRGTRSISASNEPLIIVDGVIDGIHDLNDVNSADIESISVLKDASSTAIYGARGSNGVIVITTKKGRGIDGRPNITFKTDLGFSQLPRQLDIMDATEFARYRNDYAYFFSSADGNDKIEPDSPMSKYPFPNPEAKGVGTNWIDTITRTALYQNYDLSISGASAKSSYYASAGFNETQGIIDNSGLKRYSARLKVDHEFAKWLKAGLNLSYTYRDQDENLATIGGTNWWNAAVFLSPFLSPTSDMNDLWYSGQKFNNPRIMLDHCLKNARRISLNNSAFVEVTPVKGLKLRSQFTYYSYQRHGRYYEPGYLPAKKENEGGYAKRDEYDDTSFSSENTVYYELRPKSGHNFDVLGGYTAQIKYDNNLSITGRGYTLDELTWNNMAAVPDKQNTSISTNHTDWTKMSVFGRLNYNYKERYYVTFTARYDGASNFAANKKWGFFPSASVGWRLSEEPWLKPHVEGWLDNFKIRASIGSLGNANIDPYQYLETMTATNSASIAKSSVIINGQNVPYTSVPDLIPDDITWEKVTTYNIGLDLDLFNNRLSFTGDYYRRNTTDLYTVGPNLPQVLGSAAPYGNYASLKTKGWEVSLGWRDSFKLGGKPFNYSLRAMLWDSRSWITDYYNETGDLTTYYKGMEIGEIWGFRTAGIYASNAEALNGPAYNFFKNGEMFRAYAGDLRFVDVDGDGIMTKGNRTLSNHGDMEIIGNQSPRYQYSINMSLNWNGIGLSMLWQGVGKRDWYPWTESGFFWGKWNRAYNSLMKTQTGDRVVKIDKSTDNWRVTNMDKNPYWTRMVSLAANRNDGPLTWENDHYLQDASYIRLKNITVDYTFPKHICKKLRIEGLKIYVSGENLFTHSPMFKYTDMFDPEVITSGDSDFASTQKSGLGGTGNGYSYPMLKTVTLGVNVTF